MSDFLHFALPDIGEEEIGEVVAALRSGWVTTGPRVARFEKQFGMFLGEGIHTVAVNSATAGLHLALEAVGVGAGDEVITTPYTFTATAEVVRYLNADPVFVDIDPKTYNLDASRIEEAITVRTKAIVPVHFAGMACDMERILGIARERGLRVVEDAAHAFPCMSSGNLVGTLGSDATVFSFYATKTITTGEGGMIACRDQGIGKRCRVMRLHGVDRDAFGRYTDTMPSWYYEVVAPGFKYNMTDVAAALGIQQLKKAWAFRTRREEMARNYDAAFADLPVSLPPRPAEGDIHSWHLYVLRLKDGAGVDRDTFIKEMAARGIGCSVHFIPLHVQPYWRDRYGFHPEDFPRSWENYRRSVSLPIYTRMTPGDQARVVFAVRDILAAK